MYFSDDLIEEIRLKNDIVEVVSSYVKMQKKGASYFGLCPFHNEKSPSFSVSPNKQMYYCFGCGEGGNVISFMMKYENYTFLEALQSLADRAGIRLPEEELSEEQKRKQNIKNILLEINKLAATYFYHNLTDKKGEFAKAYLINRGLSEKTITGFGLGYAGKTGTNLYAYLKSKGYNDEILKETGLVSIEAKGARDKFWNRVMFPILDINSRVIGFGGRVMGDGMPKYLNSPETKLFDKSRNLYALNFAKNTKEDYFILCEGYMDVISLHQAGFTTAIASLGTAFTPSHALLIKKYKQKIILTFDSDTAGINAAKRALPILKNAGISAKVLELKPYKDPDEFIKALGAKELEKRISEAKNAFMWEIELISKNYKMTDPEQKTLFYNEIAKKMCEFSENLERDNYIRAVSQEYFINYEELRKLVNKYGMGLEIEKEYVNARQENKRQRENLKEDGLQKSQRLLLTCLVEDLSLFEKTRDILSYEDFVDPLYKEIAKKVYEEYAKGSLSPAAIINSYLEDEELTKKVSEIFNTGLIANPTARLNNNTETGEKSGKNTDINEDDKKKAIEESIIRLKKAVLEERRKTATDFYKLQEILKEQTELSKLRISIK